MLELKHVRKAYNRNTEVLKDITFSFQEGQIYVVAGAVGSGRKTLFQCICHDQDVDGGTIVSLEKREISYAAQQSVLPLYVTGYEFIHSLCRLSHSSRHVEDVLEEVGMDEEQRGILIGNYEYEDKKRLQLAAFLVQQPYVLLVENPFDYRSEEFREQFLKVLRREKEGHVIVLSTGLLEVAEQVSELAEQGDAEDILLLHDGQLHPVSRQTLQEPELRREVRRILEEADNEQI